MQTKKLILRVLFNSLLGVFLISLWTRFVSFSEVRRILATVEPGYLILFLVVFALGGLFRAIRLRLLLNNSEIPLQKLAALTYLGQFLSFLIPVRAGEISKSVYISSRLGLPFAKSLTWIFIDRLLDFLTVLLTIIFLLEIVPTSLPPRTQGIILMIFLSFLLFLFVAVKKEQFLKDTLTFVSRYLVFRNIKRWFILFTYSVIEGLVVLRRPPIQLLFLAGLGFMALLMDALAWLSIFLALNTNFRLGEAMLGNALAALTFLIPAAPGYVGSAEAAGLAVFSGALGMNNNLASAVTLLFHALTLACILTFGLASLYLLDFDLGQVWKKLKREE